MTPLHELDNVMVILIHPDREKLSRINMLIHIQLVGLSDKASYSLIQTLTERFAGVNHGLTENERNYISHQANGNPRRIYRLVQDYLVIDQGI